MPSILLYILVLLFSTVCISALLGVPFLPTHRRQAKLMIELAEIKPGMRVIDLGSGAGRLLWLVANQGAMVTGYELNPWLYVWTKLMIIVKGLFKCVTVKFKSLFEADLRDVDVVLAFLSPGMMRKLESRLFAELKPGAKIVSYTFSFPNRTAIKKQEGIYVYRVG